MADSGKQLSFGYTNIEIESHIQKKKNEVSTKKVAPRVQQM